MINQIEKILDWYSVECDSCEIAILMRAADKLSILSYKLAEELADTHKDYNHAYFIRRISVSKTVNRLVQKGLAINKSDHEALEENEDFFLKRRKRNQKVLN